MSLIHTKQTVEIPQRGVVKRCLTLCLGVIAVAFAGMSATPALADEFVEGTHFQRLPVAVETADDTAVEVVEVFSYACVHCFNFDPMIEAWHARQSEGVNFVRLPAVFSTDYELLAQAFYTAETLGVIKAVHTPMFVGIHMERQDLRQAALLQDLFNEHADVGEEDFNTAYSSFSVRSRVQQAKAKSRAYRVTGVPSMVVNGKYLVTGTMAGSNTKMLEVVDYLVGVEQQASQGQD